MKYFIASMMAAIIFGLCIMSIAEAANHYIRAGATGNNDGSDWTNAWTGLDMNSTDFIRGHTYYIAEGTYTLNGDWDLDTPDSNDVYIYIKKATWDNHGDANDWDCDYGDGQAVIQMDDDGEEILFDTNYWDIDGSEGGGPGNWDGSVVPHGFKFEAVDLSFDGNTRMCLLFGAFGAGEPGSKYLNFRHIEFTVTGQPEFGGCEASKVSYADPNTENDFGPGHVTVEYCYFNGLGGPHIFLYEAHDWLVQYCYFRENEVDQVGGNQGSCIYDQGSDDITFRYNLFQDIEGTGFVDIKGNNDDDNENWKLYGNVVYYSSGASFETGLGNGVFVYAGNATNYVRNMLVYNNTFIGLTGNCTGIAWGSSGSTHDHSGNYVKNNIWFNCENAGHAWIDSNDYNAYIWTGASDHYLNGHGDDYAGPNTNDVSLSSSVDPFIDWENLNFFLDDTVASAVNCIDTGADLGNDYDEDWFNVDRDNNWDMGAIVSPGYHCIRQEATGNNDGSCWGDAFNDVPASWNRGHTYFFADGTHEGPGLWHANHLDDAAAGSAYIYWKKATADDHGTDTNWVSTYGDGQAIFTKQAGTYSGGVITVLSPYWDFNGVTGGGPGSWDSGHGFQIHSSEPNHGGFSIGGNLNNPTVEVHHVNISHMDFHGNDVVGVNAVGNLDVTNRVWSTEGVGWGDGPDYITVSHCWFREGPSVCIDIAVVRDITVEYCYFDENWSIQGVGHGAAVQDYESSVVRWRYNLHRNIEGTSAIDLKTVTGAGNEYYWVHGNVFYYDGSVTREEPYDGFGNGTVTQTFNDGSYPVNYIYVYNNTFINIVNGIDSGITFYKGHTHIARNNLWYGCEKVNYMESDNQVEGDEGTDYDYSAYINCTFRSNFEGPNTNDVNLPNGVDPFKDWENLDFDLNLSVASGLACDDAGESLGSPYNTDWDGTSGTNIGASQSESAEAKYLLAKEKLWKPESVWRYHLYLQSLCKQ